MQSSKRLPQNVQSYQEYQCCSKRQYFFAVYFAYLCMVIPMQRSTRGRQVSSTSRWRQGWTNNGNGPSPYSQNPSRLQSVSKQVQLRYALKAANLRLSEGLIIGILICQKLLEVLHRFEGRRSAVSNEKKTDSWLFWTLTSSLGLALAATVKSFL